MLLYQIPRALRMRTWSQSCRTYKSSKSSYFSKGKQAPNGRFLKKSEKSNFSLTKNSYFLNFCKLYKIGTMCASLEHEEFGKATCNESPVNISRLGKFRSTRYSAYNSDMGIFDLKSARLNDFYHFLRKELDFEVFFCPNIVIDAMEIEKVFQRI